jgi:hypothetical protein
MVECVLLKEGEAKNSEAQALKDAIEQNQGAQHALRKWNRLRGSTRSFRLADFIEC